MDIKITVKARYGSYDFIIIDPAQALALKAISKKSTVNTVDISALKALGHNVTFTEYAEDYINGRLK